MANSPAPGSIDPLIMPDLDRPNPDALLANLSTAERGQPRGRLKIYLGMAAGVGKTFSMLADGQEARQQGVDVVLGYLEPHGRKDTDKMAGGLEPLPLREFEHRGVVVRDFDVDAAIARKATLTLVDELAHSNPEGSRHAKRWQDVAELLDHGLDVATTVNIQHVASLRDVVAQITGVFVQETVPDALFERADEVELIDLPPEELQQRLRSGKIYTADKISQALDGFFKKANLLSLRELSLRHTADRVEVDIRKARAQNRSTEPWHAAERILVCIAPNRMAQRVVRAARRIANSLHAELLAVTVSSPRQASRGDQGSAEVDAAMRLAEELGATTATLAGDDIVTEVIRYAQQENVTTIVMGKPVRARWKEVFFGSVVDYTVRSSNDIDILIITGEEGQGTPLVRRRQIEPLRWQGFAEAVTWIAAVTWLAGFLGNSVRHANIIMLYLVGVVAVSLRHGRQEALFAAVVSVAAFNFFFVPPLYTFAVSDLQNSLTFVVMLAVAVLFSSLTLRLKEQTVQASERERNTSALYDLSRKLAGTRSKTDMAMFAVEKLSALTGADAAVLRRESQGQLKVLAGSGSGFETSEKEQAVAAWVIEHGRAAGSTTDTLAGAQALYLPLLGSANTLGTIGISLSAHAPLSTGKRHLAEAVASLLSTALDRAEFAKVSNLASLQAESERLRGDLLSSVSHDLRTPLASISGAATVLQAQPELTPRNQELAKTIVEESDRMGRLVRNLLDMTRVQGIVDLNIDWQTVQEIVGSAVERTAGLFDQPVVIKPSEAVIVKIDGVLFEQVLVNLLENASRHAGREAKVEISVGQAAGRTWIEVSDNGSGIPAGEETAIFDRFKKGEKGGIGLGLAICKAAIEAHKGKILASQSATGAKFRIEIPMTNEENDA